MLSREWRKMHGYVERRKCQGSFTSDGFVIRIWLWLSVTTRPISANQFEKSATEANRSSLVTDGLNRKEDSLSSSESSTVESFRSILEELAALCGELQSRRRDEGDLHGEILESPLSFAALIEKTEQGQDLWSRGFEDGQYKTLLPGGKIGVCGESS